jgi:hypothetical protein
VTSTSPRRNTPIASREERAQLEPRVHGPPERGRAQRLHEAHRARRDAAELEGGERRDLERHRVEARDHEAHAEAHPAGEHRDVGADLRARREARALLGEVAELEADLDEARDAAHRADPEAGREARHRACVEHHRRTTREAEGRLDGTARRAGRERARELAGRLERQRAGWIHVALELRDRWLGRRCDGLGLRLGDVERERVRIDLEGEDQRGSANDRLARGALDAASTRRTEREDRDVAASARGHRHVGEGTTLRSAAEDPLDLRLEQRPGRDTTPARTT